MRFPYGDTPRPRLLVVALPDELQDSFRHLTPSVRFVAAGEFYTTINQAEWEAIVLWDCDAPIRPDTYVVQFGGKQTARISWRVHGFAGTATDEQVSRTYAHAKGRPGEVDSLIDSLGNFLADRGRSRVLEVGISEALQPFLLNANGKPVAGIYRRSDATQVEWWWLPMQTPNPAGWVAAALGRWRSLDADKFEPDVLEWRDDERWQTVEERQIAAEMETLDAEHQAATDRYDAQRAALETTLTQASDAAERTQRRLLTEKGDPLKEQVARTFEDLGFLVTDADRDVALPGDLLEDLRVEDPGVPDWIALVEVRGYKGGAKVSDLQRIGRFEARFAVANQRMPSCSWYVVNQFNEQDPGGRPRPLDANPEELALFAETGGLVVDTRALFELKQKVADGQITASEARERLRGSCGQFGFEAE